MNLGLESEKIEFKKSTSEIVEGVISISAMLNKLCILHNTKTLFVPVDATVNVCGTAVFKLNNEISVQKFIERVETVLADRTRYTWNYTNGNHFISLCRSNGEYDTESGYYMVVHASANEVKDGPNGLK